MTRRIIMYTGTVEYLSLTLSSDVDLVDQTIEFSFDRTTWLPAAWVGDVAPTRSARVLLNATTLPAPGVYPVFARLTDSPEIPVMDAGELVVR